MKDHLGLARGPCFLSLCFRSWLTGFSCRLCYVRNTKFHFAVRWLLSERHREMPIAVQKSQFSNIPTAYSWWESLLPPLVGMLSVVLRKRGGECSFEQKKIYCSSPWSLQGLPFSGSPCWPAFLWAQARTRDDWNVPDAMVAFTSSPWALVKATVYLRRLPQDQFTQ